MFSRLQKLGGRSSSGKRSAVRLYRRYRAASKDLNHKIIDATLETEAIQFAARALGMKGPGNMVIFDTEDDTSILMDFAMYECKAGGKNAVERYQEEIGDESEIERVLLEVMVASSTSLFRIESISKRSRALTLIDLVNENRTLTLADINFSQSAQPGYLLFLRPFTFENFSMTSGIALLFPSYLERKLLSLWRNPQSRGSRRRRRPVRPISALRYAVLFKLSKREGLEVMFQDVKAK